jgi:hypothetical protein
MAVRLSDINATRLETFSVFGELRLCFALCVASRHCCLSRISAMASFAMECARLTCHVAPVVQHSLQDIGIEKAS